MSRSILESISDSFVALDAQWRFTYVNAEAERTIGSSRGDLMGRALWDVFPMLNGTDLQARYNTVMSQRVSAQLEYYFEPGQRWLELRVYPAKDGGISVFYQDITQRKRTEDAMRRANEALRNANSDLEQFAYSASHDLREPLRMVRIYCQLLSIQYAGKMDSDADEMIGYCVEGTRRMDALINDLLALHARLLGTGRDPGTCTRGAGSERSHPESASSASKKPARP